MYVPSVAPSDLPPPSSCLLLSPPTTASALLSVCPCSQTLSLREIIIIIIIFHEKNQDIIVEEKRSKFLEYSHNIQSRQNSSARLRSNSRPTYTKLLRSNSSRSSSASRSKIEPPVILPQNRKITFEFVLDRSLFFKEPAVPNFSEIVFRVFFSGEIR
jgi:hypothetical protein